MSRKIYGIKRFDSNELIFYDNFDDAKKYMQMFTKYIDDIFILEYLGEYANRKDVIRKTITNQLPIIVSAVDEEGYEIYNQINSKPEQKQFVWDYVPGNLKEEYNMLEKFGIEFEKNIYNNKSL